MIADFVVRMVEEEAELAERVRKLGVFVASDSFAELDILRQVLLKAQQQFMLGYLDMLRERILVERLDE